MNPGGFIALHRGKATIDLLRDSAAFGLLALICLRARWRSDPSPDGLLQGEARVGAEDVQIHLGLSRKAYRGALQRLVALRMIEVSAQRGIGTVARIGAECIFSSGAPKRAISRAISGAICFQRENAAEGANRRAKKGPLKNNETTRVQNPAPRAGVLNPEKGTKREAPSGSLSFDEMVAEVEAMPEFKNRADVRQIAEIVGVDRIRSVAHLARCVRNERAPRFKRAPKTPIIEPPGWREFLLQNYPNVIFLDRSSDRYAERWEDLPKEYQLKFSKEMSACVS